MALKISDYTRLHKTTRTDSNLLPDFSLLTEVSGLPIAESVSFMETDKFPVFGSDWK